MPVTEILREASRLGKRMRSLFIALIHLQSLPRRHAKFTDGHPTVIFLRAEYVRIGMGMLVASSKL
jgi:hypothetical protein